MFTRYAAIGVGHDTVQLRHKHGLVDDQLAADNDEDVIDEVEDTWSSCASQNDRNTDEEDEDEGENDESSSVSDSYDDSDIDVCF